MRKERNELSEEMSLRDIAKAIFTINRHAKAAPEPQQLYHLKKKSILKLLDEKKAKKIGLHYSKSPRLNNNHSTILVKVADYYFHIIPEKEDFKKLKHLGELDENFRNPRTNMSLSKARKIIYKYLGWEYKRKRPRNRRPHNSSYYIPSSLGKMEWPPTRTHHSS